MLESNDRAKIEQYVDKISGQLRARAEKDIKAGVANKDVLDNLVKLTVGKLTPESKSILSSVYNMLMEQTLSKELYQDPKRKAAYYEMDILTEITSKFNFDVPSHIDYEESKSLINKWTASGAVVFAGGVVSIPLKSWIPVGVAAVIAALMIFLIDDKKGKDNDIHRIVDTYLSNVKKSLMDWVSSVEKYYDKRVQDLESETE